MEEDKDISGEIHSFLKSKNIFYITDKSDCYINCPFCKVDASSKEVRIYYNGDFFCKKCDVACNWEEFCTKISDSDYRNIKRNFKQEYIQAIQSKDPGATKLITYEFSEYLIEKFNVKTIRTPKNFEMFVYKEGVYIDGYNAIREAIRDELEDFASKHYINEILETIKDKSTIERSELQVIKELINLNNGTYDISQNKLLEHNPANLFLSKLNVTYDPNADCKTIKSFLNEMLGEEYVPVVQELFGYLLYRSHSIKKAFILVGVPNTGKTTFIKIIYKFLGVDNITSIDLQTLSQGRFGTSSLYSKYANIYDDLSSDDITGTGIFKMLTGDGPVSGEKKFGDRFVFMNYAKLIFACNKIPQIKDVDDPAYFERWIVFPFENQIKKENKDIQLTEKLTSKSEMSGLFNFALEGLNRLIENRSFSYLKEWEEVKEEMMCSGNPVAEFTYQVLEKDEQEYITKQNMYSVFSAYRISKNLPYRSEKSLGYSLPRVAPYISSGKPVKNDGSGKQVTAWMGVRVKDEFKHLVPQEVTTTESEELPSYEELMEVETAEPQNLGF
jgi:putative DNA primase/helicase